MHGFLVASTSICLTDRLFLSHKRASVDSHFILNPRTDQLGLFPARSGFHNQRVLRGGKHDFDSRPLVACDAAMLRNNADVYSHRLCCLNVILVAQMSWSTICIHAWPLNFCGSIKLEGDSYGESQQGSFNLPELSWAQL
jgi:hypothetical protein